MGFIIDFASHFQSLPMLRQRSLNYNIQLYAWVKDEPVEYALLQRPPSPTRSIARYVTELSNLKLRDGWLTLSHRRRPAARWSEFEREHLGTQIVISPPNNPSANC